MNLIAIVADQPIPSTHKATMEEYLKDGS